MKNCLRSNVNNTLNRGLRKVCFEIIRIFFPAKILIAILLLSGAWTNARAADETLTSGAYIIDMGVQPQTFDNGLVPYGMVHDLVKNYGVPVKWVINPSKVFYGTDFTYNGYEYKGGPFIIPSEYRSTDVNLRISYWEGRGVQGTTTTSPITVPVEVTLRAMPVWTLDADNGGIAEGYIENAEIPEICPVTGKPNYDWEDPQLLDCCNDIFMMPHADLEWDTHSNLYGWNLTCDGAIWLACHAGSALELMFNPAIPDQQTNFLSKKIGEAEGGGPYADPSNSLVHWGDHDDGSLPYNMQHPTDPFMQIMGPIDEATENGSEQIYIPVSGGGWRLESKVYVYDPDHSQASGTTLDLVAANVVSGRGFGDPDRGRVMLESSHSQNKSDDPANVAAQRIFFNFSFFTANEKAVIPEIGALPDQLYSGVPQTMSFTLPAGADINDYTITWASSCGGSFSPVDGQTTTFTPPLVTSETNCYISVKIEDICGRVFEDRDPVLVTCEVHFTAAGTSPTCNGYSNGEINITVTLGASPFTYSWTRTPSGSGSGSGTQITGLSAGNYSITVTDNGGAGCSGETTISLSEPAALSINSSVTDVLCGNDPSGAIDVTVTGGTAPYSFDWGGGITTEDRSNLTPDTYGLTVSDANGCTENASIDVNGPSAIVITPTVTDVLCYGEITGAIDLAVSGGNAGYTYLWNDGNSDQNRTGLAAGTYIVTITDATGCEASLSIDVDEPAAALAAGGVVTDVQCAGTATGEINLTVTGGTAVTPYTFVWSNSATTEDLTGLVAGTYTVTVTDNNGCTVIEEFIVDPASPLELSVSKDNTDCVSTADGSVTLTVSGGTTLAGGPPDYYFDWDNDGTGDNDDPQNLTNLVPDIYTVIVTDANGCTATISATVGYDNPDPVPPATINH